VLDEPEQAWRTLPSSATLSKTRMTASWIRRSGSFSSLSRDLHEADRGSDDEFAAPGLFSPAPGGANFSCQDTGTTWCTRLQKPEEGAVTALHHFYRDCIIFLEIAGRRPMLGNFSIKVMQIIIKVMFFWGCNGGPR
jgi:hypothetical protein